MELLILGFSAMLINTTPLLLAATGELLTERSGVLNLGLEGIMLTGALAAAVVTLNSGNALLGMGAALLAGALLVAIHAYVVVERAGKFSSSAIVLSGLTVGFLGSGLTNLLGKTYINIPFRGLNALDLGTLDDLPLPLALLLRAFLEHTLLVPLSLVLVITLHLFLKHTRWGLRIRLCGENPMAAESVGIDVRKVRWISTLIGGAIVGLGGASLTLSGLSAWQSGMTVGKGWIAVGLVVFSGWRPLRLLGGALLFGWVLGFIPRAQLLGWFGSSYFLAMIPYLVIILALVFARGNRQPPAMLARPFQSRESVP